nr:hypothetical protein [uncultured Sediminibacterium sp.]
MRKFKMVVLVFVVVSVILFCVWRWWPSADQWRDMVIDLYIKIFCEK